jgi:hypothetical protein
MVERIGVHPWKGKSFKKKVKRTASSPENSFLVLHQDILKIAALPVNFVAGFAGAFSKRRFSHLF